MRRRTLISFVISILTHGLALIILGIEFNLNILTFTEEAPVIVPSKSIEVDLIEGMPHIPRPLFGRDLTTTGLKKVRTSSLRRRPAPPSLGSSPKLELQNLARPEIGSGFTALNRVDPGRRLEGDEMPNIDLSEPELTTQDTTAEETRSGEPEEKPSSQGDVDSQMADRLAKVAAWLGRHSRAESVDIAFILDTSGSMEDNIVAVGNHLDEMMESLKMSGLDARVAVVKFRYLKRDMLVFPFTKDVARYQRLLKNVKCYGDERAYDAIWKALDRLHFRRSAERHFILITDEPMKGDRRFLEVVSRCRRERVAVTVIGIDDLYHKSLAKFTGGVFIEIPR